MATNEIVKQQNAALSEFGGRDEIRELAERLRIMMPNAQKLNDNEARAVAQIAIAHQLDPFNGEVWGIKGDDKWYGVMVGIKGLRRSARREARKNQSDFITSFHKVDPAKYSAKPDEVVYECHLRDTKDFQSWVKMSIDMTVAKMDKDFILAAIGPAPVVIGVGIARPGERSKMELHSRAKKRAEADAIKQKYDVSFGPGVVTDADTIDGDVEAIIESGNSGPDLGALENQDAGYVEGETQDMETGQNKPPESPLNNITPEESAYLQAKEVETPGGNLVWKLSDEQLIECLKYNEKHPDVARAATAVIAWRAILKKREAEVNKQLGFE